MEDNVSFSKDPISFFQKRIIVHSILYYQMDSSIIPDKTFDKFSRLLVDLMKTTPREILEKSRYWYAMDNFDGATGFDLYSRLTREDQVALTGLAHHLLRLHEKYERERNEKERYSEEAV